MPAATANGITIEYETFGDPGAEPVLLIMGLSGQLTMWNPDFCRALADAGFHVIRFDNRDVGLSTWFDAAGLPDLATLLGGSPPTPPYTLSDMAADAAGLLDALGLPSAHIVGVSMGGMIAQTFAIAYPARTRTLVSVMSTTGDPTVGQPRADALAALLGADADDPRRGDRAGDGTVAGHRLTRLSFRRAHGARPGRGRIRPGLQSRRGRPPDRRDPLPTRPHPETGCGARPSPRRPRACRTRSSTRQVGGRPPRPFRVPASSSSRGWATTSPVELFAELVPELTHHFREGIAAPVA